MWVLFPYGNRVFVSTFFLAVFDFSPTAKLAMGSLAQNSSGAIQCSCNTRFRRRFRRVQEGSGAFRCRLLMRFRRGSGAFRCRLLMRFQTVPVQIARKVPEGSGADGWWGSGGFGCRWLMRFRRVPGQIADEVPKGSGTKTFQDLPSCWGSHMSLFSSLSMNNSFSPGVFGWSTILSR